jgi:hypothetical protein
MKMSTDKTKSIPRFIPIAKWDQYYDWPSVPGLRYHIFNAKTNGLERFNAIRRVGRRILIDPVAFHAWVDSNPSTGGKS